MLSRVTLEQQAAVGPAPPLARSAPPEGPRFADVLKDAVGTGNAVRVSAHAAQRLQSRGVQLSSGDLARVGRALDQLAAKGGREALLLVEDVALVASVPNRTIITAVAPGDGGASVFTNIDSAAVLPAGRAEADLKTTHGPDPLRDARTPLIDRRGVST